jgi:hypothetical protein
VDLTNADIRKFIPEKALKDAQVVAAKGFGVAVYGAKFVRDNAKTCGDKLQHFMNRCD